MTCRHYASYTVGTMAQANLQLTIRGVDKRTKELLQQKAAQKGVSMNRLSLDALRQEAGSDSSEERYRRMKAFFAEHRISSADIKAAEEAIAWQNRASLRKQKKDERELFGL